MRTMSYSVLAVLLFLGLMRPGIVQPQAQVPTIAPDVILTSPREGEALQGVVNIEGRVQGEGVKRVRVSFAYAEGTPGSWFYISEVKVDTQGGSQEAFQMEWDTTKITDGNYVIRARVNFQDGGRVVATVSGLRIRNYSPIETATPRPPGTVNATNQVTETGEAALVPTPSPLPPNPATLQEEEIYGAVLKGLGLVGGSFLLYGLYRWVQHRRQSF